MAEKHAATYHPHLVPVAPDLRYATPLTIALLRLDGAIARLQSAGAKDRLTIALADARLLSVRYEQLRLAAAFPQRYYLGRNPR